MAAKNTKSSAALTGQGVRRRFKVELDKVAMTAAALGTIFVVQQAEAAEKAKQKADVARADELAAEQSLAELTEHLSKDVPPEQLAAELQQMLEELQAAGEQLDEEATAEADAEAEGAEGEQVAAEGEIVDGEQVADSGTDSSDSLDGTQLAQANTMSEAGAGGGGGGAGGATAGSAAGADAAATGIAGDAAAGSLAQMSSVTLGTMSIPVGVIAGASVIAAAAVAGGGGSSSTGDGSQLQTQLNTTTGLVVDGNVRDATIFYDRNGNGVLDAGEISTKTKADGTYEMVGDAALMTGKLVVLGDGFDVLTGQKVGMMTAPDGFAFVSPLTTLVAAAGGDAASQNAMLAKLGLSGAGLGGKTPLEFLKTYDPVKAMTQGTPEEKALAEKAFTVSQQVFAVIQTASELQAKVGGGTSAGLSNITDIAKSIAQSISNAPATTSGGAAVSATSLINQAANKAVSTALSNASPETQLALQANVTRALSNVNDAIATKYTGLADALTASAANPTDPATIGALAEKMAVAAVSQNTLISGIRAIDTTNSTTLADSQDSLLIAGDKEALEKLQTDVFVDAVKAGSSTATAQFLALSSPDILTATKFTIVDTQANILAYGDTSVFDRAIGVVVSDPIDLSVAEDLISLIPAVAFRNPEVTFSTPNPELSYTNAMNLIDSGIRFPVEADLTVTFTTAELDDVIADAIMMSLAGVQNISVTGSGTLGPAQGFTLFEAYAIADAELTFDAANTITVGVDEDDLSTVADNADLFKDAGIDALGAVSGTTLTVRLDDAIAITNAGLVFTAGNTVTASLFDNEPLLASHAQQLKDGGVDQIQSAAGPGSGVVLTYAQATALVAANLPVVGGGYHSQVGVFATETEAATLPAASFAGINIEIVAIWNGQEVGGTIALTSLASILPHLLVAANSVTITSADSALLEANAAGISAVFNFSHLVAPEPAALTLTSLLAADDNGLSFSSDSDITVQVENASVAALMDAVESLVAAGVDHVGAPSGTLLLTIDQALQIVEAGLDFVGTEVTVQFDPADIATLAAAAADLQAAGVDYIDPISSPLVLTLEEAEAIFEVGFAFDPSTAVSLEVLSTELHSLTDPALADLLISNNLNSLTVTDLPELPNPAMPLHGTLAAELFDLGFDFAPAQNITLLISNADDFAAATANAAAFYAGGLTTLIIAPTDSDALSAILALPTFATDIAALELVGYAIDSIDFSLPLLTEAEALAVIAAGLDFGDATTNPVTLEVGDGVSTDVDLEISLKQMQSIGVATVLMGPTGAHLSFDLGTTGLLIPGSLPMFGSDIHVGLNITDAQLSEITSVDGLASELALNGIDALLTDGDILITTEDAAQLMGDPLDVNDNLYVDGQVSLAMDDADLADVIEYAQPLVEIGVDTLDVVDNTLTLNQDQAGALIDVGLEFAAGDTDITMDVSVEDGTATYLNTSLKDLQKLGVDKVMLNGGLAGDVGIDIGFGDPLTAGGLPQFGDLNVSLGLDQGDLDTVLATDGLAGALGSSGIDQLDMYANAATIDLDQAAQLAGANLEFNADDAVTLSIDESNVSDAAAVAQDLADIGVDYLSAGQALTISDPDAAALGGAGLNFDESYEVTLDADASGSGTHLSSSLKDLQKLGVDKVMLNGGAAGELSLGLGAGDALGVGGLPMFEDGLDVTLSLNDQLELNEVLGVDGLAASLNGSGVDQIDMAGNSATIDIDQAYQMAGTDLSFSAEDMVTLTVDQTSVSDAAMIAQQLSDMGVDYLAGDQPLTIGDDEAASLAGANLSFDDTYDVTLNVDDGGTGTHLSSSLKDLQKLGVDNVMLHGGAGGDLSLGLGTGESLGAGGELPVFDSQLNVSLQLDQDGLNEVLGEDGVTAALDANGIDQFDMAGDAATIDMNQAAQFAGGDLTFADEDIVTLTVDDLSVSDAAANAQQLVELGVDFLAADGGTLTIGDADASALAQTPLEFNADDMVTLEVTDAGATHLSTSLKDLQKLGVDKVMLGGLAAEAGTLTVDAGDGAWGTGGLPQFDLDDHITLSIGGTDEDAFHHLADLKEAGVDTLFVEGDTPVFMDLAELEQFIGPDLHYAPGDLQFSADNNVTLEVDDIEMDTALDHLTGLQGAGVDTVDMDDNTFTLGEHTAEDLLSAGLKFAEDDIVTLDASQSDGTHLSTSLKDLQKLGVDAVSGMAAASVALELGDGAFGGGSVTFGDDLDVTLSVNTGQLNEVLENANALDTMNIDTLRMHGTKDELDAVDGNLAQLATVDEITLDTTGDDLMALLSGGLDAGEMPSVGDIDTSRIDVIGASGNTGEFNLDLEGAQALIDAGIAFESMDNITLDITQGAGTGTSLATQFDEMQKLGVDKINFNLDGAPGFELAELPDFDDELDVTLNVGDEDIGEASSELALALHDLGFDNIAFDESVADIGGELGYLSNLLGELTTMTDAGLGLGVNITEGAGQSLDDALFAGMNVGTDNVADLVAALSDSGVTEMVVKSDVEITDELLNALADAGMLNALPEANLSLDATESGDRLYTSLKEMADLDVDQVTANIDGNLYIDLGELGQGDALAEIKELLANLDADMFTGATTPTLVLDLQTAEAISQSGVFDSDIMAGLESIGIKEIGVLVGHNQHTDIVAQTMVPVEVKLIGQSTDPLLWDDLQQPKA